jgi:hypothetical protein
VMHTSRIMEKIGVMKAWARWSIMPMHGTTRT